MADWTVHLEFEEGTSSKFWRARIEGGTLYVNYGKIGTAGQTQVKELGTAAAAEKEYDKLVREKTKKGYAPSGDAGSKGAADDEDDDGEDSEDAEDEEADEAPKKPAKPAPAPAARPAASSSAGRPAGATRLTLAAGSRKVETFISIEGGTVRMESLETYATPEAAKKAFERLKKTLGGEGYSEG